MGNIKLPATILDGTLFAKKISDNLDFINDKIYISSIKPLLPYAGQLCFDLTDNTLYAWNAGTNQWDGLSGGGSSPVMDSLTINKGLIVNEQGGDNDTRIEGDTEVNLLFVDASADRIGIKTNSPDYDLHIVGTLGVTDNITMGAGKTIDGVDISEHNHNGAGQGGEVSHTYLTDKGTNTHAQIDTAISNSVSHIADDTIHFVQGSIDHGSIAGLTDDDHTQYLLRQPTANVVINESGGDFNFRIESDGNANMFFLDAGKDAIGIGTGSPNSSVDLHINSKLLVGSVDGLANVLSVGGASTAIARFEQTDEATARGSWLWLFEDDGTDADNSGIAFRIISRHPNSGTGKIVQITNVDGSVFNILDNGSIIINEDSNDCDFRVESNGNANMFFVDGGNDRVGIGMNSPNEILTVEGVLSLKETSAPSNTVGYGKLYVKEYTGLSPSYSSHLYFMNDDGLEYDLLNLAVADHGLLDGLDDDDHTQYLLASGSRNLSGNLAVDAGVTIDGIDISAHAGDSEAHHNEVTVAGAPLTLSTQELTFNYDTDEFDLDGNNLILKAGGVSASKLGAPMGSWIGKSLETSYEAGTDGFIVGYVVQGTNGNASLVAVLTENADPPTVTVQALKVERNVDDEYEAYASFCIPVKKGDYYKVTKAVGDALTSSAMWFIGIGS